MSSSSRDTIIKFLTEKQSLDTSTINNTTLMSDLLDSLGVLELVLSLEDCFEIALPDEDFELEQSWTFERFVALCDFHISVKYNMTTVR